MTDFHFIRPLWLLALIVLVWLIWQLRKIRISSSAWHQVIPKHLTTMLLSSDENKKPASLIPAAIIGLLFIVAMAGPTWQKLPQPVFAVERGSVLIMDMSFSMLATDIKPNRLTMARFKAMDLIEKIDEGEIGLVAYAGDAFIISPLTADIENIKLLLPSLSPSIMPELGSNPYPSLILANEMLQNAGHIEGDIYWLTDGISSDELTDINDFASSHPHRINILAVGTEQGAPITLANGELMKDRGGNIVIPKLNARRLAGISSNSGGIFSQISADDSDIVRLSELKVIDAKKELAAEQENMGDQWQEVGPYLLLLALPLMLTYFRRGILFTPVLLSLLIATSMHSSPVQANIWDDLWKTSDQQGQQSFDKQQYTDAATQFNDPLWQGSSFYKAGEYDKALEAYKRVDSVESWYNQGNSLAKLQQLDDAISAYDKVLAKQPEHADAASNKALLEQLQEQQEQEQSDQSQSSDEQEQNEQQQDNQQQQEQNGQDGENQDQSEQQSDQQQSDQQNEDQQNEDQQQQEQEQDSASQESPQGDQNPNENESEQQSRDNEQQNAEQNESEQEQNAAAQAENGEQSDEQQSQQQQSAALSDTPTAEELEEMQKHEQLLRKVTDDPQLLLRNKMKLEYQKRRQNRSSIGVKEKW